MNADIPYSNNPGRGMVWALLGAFIGHAGFFAAILMIGVIASPFQNQDKIIIQIPHGMSLDVRTETGTSAKPKGEDRVYNVANAVAPTPAPARRPAPTPAPTPAATPAPDENKIVVPDKTATATPEPKKAPTNTKVIKATPPPETPKVVASAKTPAADQKNLKGGSGTGALSKNVADGPPTIPSGPTGPGVKGDPNAPINTNVVLPSDYLADLVSSLRANFSVPNNLQGVCVIEFKIARDGTLRDIKVLTSSGFPSIDAIAFRAVQTTAHVRAYAAYTQVPEITAAVPFHFGPDAPAAAAN